MSKFIAKLRWYYATRTIGTTMVLYELFFALGTPERGTIILVGAGMLGFDFVVRRDDKRYHENRKEHRDLDG